MVDLSSGLEGAIWSVWGIQTFPKTTVSKNSPFNGIPFGARVASNRIWHLHFGALS